MTMPTHIGRYEVQSELGRGGMAIVYLANDPYMGREVAVKVLPRQFTFDETFRARFQREAQTVAALEHPAIVPIYDFGEHEEQPFIVMRYMYGGSLADRIKRGPLPLDAISTILHQIGGALDEAHVAGLIHRDIKPSNILFDRRQDAHIADFGVVKLSEATAQLTGSGIVGTPAYMAPEISQPGGLTPLIDIYALGVTLFQMLSGRLPYEADTPMGILMAHGMQPIPNIITHRPELPASIQEIIERGLAKDPMDRYQNAAQLAEDFAAVIGDSVTPPAAFPRKEEAVSIPTPPDALTMDGPPPPPASTTPQAEPQPAPRGKRKFPVLPVVLAGIAAIVIIGVILGRSVSRQPETIVETILVEEAAPIEETAPVEEATPVEGEAVVQEVAVTATPMPETAPLEIFHWWTGPGEIGAVDAMFTALADKYPEIEVIENPVSGGGVSHRAELQNRLAAGLPPDTFQTLGGAELKSYVDGNALEPLDDLYAELGYADVIPGPLLDAVSIDGHPYVVPLNIHIQNILYYDIALFEELGLEPPMNFDDLMATCEVVVATYPDKACLGLGTVESWEAAFVLDSILLEEGGPEYYVALYKGEIDVTTDETYRASLEKLAELTPYLNADHPSLSWDRSVGLVANGDAAMVIMGTWGIGTFISYGWEPGEDFGAVNFPQEPERILLFHPDTYGLAVGAPHPETTLKWLEVVASPELQIPTDVAQGGLFARMDIDPAEFPDPIRQEMQQYVAANPGQLILDQHGSIAPYGFTNEYWIVIAAFMADANPDVDATIEQVAALFETYYVREQSAWYQWP